MKFSRLGVVGVRFYCRCRGVGRDRREMQHPPLLWLMTEKGGEGNPFHCWVTLRGAYAPSPLGFPISPLSVPTLPLQGGLS